MEWKIVVDTACDFREIPNKAENVTYERESLCRYARFKY